MLKQFRAASPAQQLLMALVLILGLTAVLAVVYFTVIRQPYEVLFGDVKPADAATIVAELDKKKIPYRLEDRGTVITVPAKVVDRTRLEIMSADLPLKGGVGFELFNKSDMGLTEFAQKINYQRALQGELARTISTMEGVISARVHLSLPEQTIFRDDRRPAKASVTIITRPDRPLTPATVRGVQRLVAAAVSDLSLADVVILNDRGEVVSGGAPLEARTAADADASPGMQAKTAVEALYAARVRHQIGQAYPGRPAKVEVLAGLEPDLEASGLQGWSREPRSFPLHVTIVVEPSESTEVQAQMASLAHRAILADPLRGDAVAVTTSLSTGVPIAAELAPARDMIRSAEPTFKPATPARGPTPAIWAMLLAPLLATVAAVFIGVRLARRGRSALSASQRSQFSDRLKTLLEERDARARTS